MADQATIIQPGNAGQFNIPVPQSRIQRVDVVDVDMVLMTDDGQRFILPGAGIDAMSAEPPAIVFPDGDSSAALMLESVGVVETPDISIPVMSSLTEYDAKTSAGDLSFHGDGISDGADTGQENNVSPVNTATDNTVEKMLENVEKAIENLNDKAADPVPEQTMDSMQSAATGVGAAPNPVSLTPLVEITLGNVESDTTTPLIGAGGPVGTSSKDDIGVRDPGQFSTETLTGTAGDDVMYADGSDVGGVSYNADGTVSGTALFAKEMAVQISGYFTSLTSITVSGLPSTVTLIGNGDAITDNGDGTWSLPVSYLTDDDATFKIQYEMSEYGTEAAETFTMTMDITGVTRGTSFHSQSDFTVSISDAASSDDISQTDSDGSAIYVLPAQGTPNYLDAGEGDDIIHAGYGNDTVIAGDGADTVYAGYGVDSIVGGDGDDVIYSQLSDQGDTVYGDAGNDTIYASDGDDLLYGGDDDDLIEGNAGMDTIHGGLGVNSLDGGDDNDTLSFSDLAVSATADLSAGTATVSGATSTFTNFENLEGSTTGDTLTGDANANTISGLQGADTIDGAGGADSLYGNEGDDTVNVTVAGAVTVDGGDGQDTLDLTSYSSTLRVSLDGSESSYGIVDGTVFTDFEIIKFGDGRSYFVGTTANETVYGGAGYYDSIRGGGGDDTLYGGDGRDNLYGDDGDDVIYASDSFNAADSNATSSTYANYLYGNNGNDTLYGGDQDDYLDGDSGDDTLYGGDGDDMLRGEGGDDYMDGGDGSDTLVFTDNYWHDATLDSSDGSVTITGDSRSAMLGDTIINVENLTGGSGSDTFTISGGGDHILNGNNGSDILTGGTGSDTFVFSKGNDVVDGGDGEDTIYYTGSTDVKVYLDASVDVEPGDKVTGVSVSSGGFAWGLDGTSSTNKTTLANVENIITGSGNDVLAGDSNANTLSSGAGDDALYGEGGADVLIGGTGDDIFYLDASELADITAGGGSIDGGVNESDTLDLTGVVGGAFGDTEISVLNSIEVLDLKDTGAATDLTLTASQVQDIVDGGTSSELTLYLDFGGSDTFTADGSNVTTSVGSNSTTYSYFSDATLTTQIAQVEVYYT